MQTNITLEERIFNFMDNLVKGDEFLINKKKYLVKAIGKFKLNSMKEDGRTITIKSETEQIKFFRFCGYGGNPASNGRKAEVKQYHFLRNAEGQILVDLLNINNPFHELSEIYKIALRKEIIKTDNHP